MSKKLSIAIPTYNRLNYLKDCIKSILNQTFQDFSIFVFDNASDEPIDKELKQFNDERIRFIGSDKHVSAWENGIRISRYPFKSKYLTIFHDDDLMHPRMLELQTSFLDKNRDVVFVVSKFNRVYSKDIRRFQDFFDNRIKYIIYKDNYEFTKAIISWLEYAFDSAMYRTKFWTRFYSGVDFDIFSDFTDIVSLVEISKNGPCALIDMPLVNYRIHSGQDFQLLKENYEDGALKTLSFFRENLPPLLDRKDKKLFQRYSLNFLIRAYVDINEGFLDFFRFIKKCRQKKIIKYSYFRYIDMRGIIAMVSIILKNKKIINIARFIKDFLKK